MTSVLKYSKDVIEREKKRWEKAQFGWIKKPQRASGIFLHFFAQLFHSLDIWQKSAKLSKALSEASKIKGCEDLAEWISPIRNHFWHCFEASNGDLERLKDTWLGITHHVHRVNINVWMVNVHMDHWLNLIKQDQCLKKTAQQLKL